MTDPWARPTDDGAPAQRRPVDAFEIELDGPDNLPVGGSNDAPDDEPNWRKVAGIASISGVLLGVVVSALVFWNDGRDDAPATTTVPRDELAAEITTPPTLPPVETTPTTTVPTPGRPELATRDITVPSYPAPDDPGAPWPDAPIRFPTLDESLTVEVVTDNLYGDEPTATSVRYDAVNGRYEISSRLPVGTATMIYDSSTDSIYEGIVRPRSGIDTIWTRRPGSDWFAGES
ncbi:MAG: hypothetical protein KDB37_20370, partial [Ilumatobacter sp.]|nr:hypothetical protein [Ilumatobacter sp.]